MGSLGIWLDQQSSDTGPACGVRFHRPWSGQSSSQRGSSRMKGTEVGACPRADAACALTSHQCDQPWARGLTSGREVVRCLGGTLASDRQRCWDHWLFFSAEGAHMASSSPEEPKQSPPGPVRLPVGSWRQCGQGHVDSCPSGSFSSARLAWCLCVLCPLHTCTCPLPTWADTQQK